MKSAITSSLPAVSIPSTDIATFFFASVRQLDEFSSNGTSPRPLFIDGSVDNGESLDLEQFETLCTRLAAGLYHKTGVRQTDVVAVVLPNSIHYPAVILAVLMLGAACTLVNPAYTEREIAHQMRGSGAKFAITVAELHPTVAQASPGLNASTQILVVDSKSGAEPSGLSSIFDVLTDDAFPRVAWTETAGSKQDSAPAFIPYSSGTTGMPKGVVLSHRNIVANLQQALSIQTTLDRPRTSIAVLPMFHSFGLLFLCFLMPIAAATTVVMPRFEMARFLQLIETHKATDAMLVPPIVNALAKMPDAIKKYNLTSLAEIVVGAAPLSASAIAAVEKLMPHVRVLQGFGLTEGSPAISLNPRNRRCVDSVGRLLPNIEAKVLDSDGRVLGPDAVGELCFRGPNIMLGYLNNPQETQRAIDVDGFFHTGDIGYIDQSQFVFITDRKKELIKYNGFQVAPAELEGILMRHPEVRDCAVVGVFDEHRQTEVPRAFVVLETSARDGQSAAGGAGHIVDWANGQVAYYKQLRGGYSIVESIPRSASGKILRRMLKPK
ncbi:hypothetical protein H4R99_003828 [Coemansia sp. RSA 1722]|nr:hypothetical protein LPJ57_001305 [Coemansia sp. RSA 486]KAJ2232696.1 hypothetical protein IWW45_004763 [Coemansia sp. RSA 485]KAJ2598136.1 hypothetical protein GGF39_002773 [Coemansia sp. RSA 1721]KAJ2599142.1 hypothetical protein H4R99_003828 [Coemansia sp. RSA 1722]KAJ2636694.1 hypothetical protein GGF40_002852 [Coemansia sp. RSA 1286]